MMANAQHEPGLLSPHSCPVYIFCNYMQVSYHLSLGVLSSQRCEQLLLPSTLRKE